MGDKEKFLVIGADGFIGKALSLYLKNKGCSVIETTRKTGPSSAERFRLDLFEDLSRWEPPLGVTYAFLLAGITSLEECRKNPSISRKINVDQTVLLAEKLNARGIRVLFPSTNLVFDGLKPFRKITDMPSPDTVYGRQKVAVEERIAAWHNLSVVRFTKIIGPDHALFRSWIQNLTHHKPIQPFSDVAFSPFPLLSALEALEQIALGKIGGLFHASGSADITYEEAARYLAKRLGADDSLVEPCSSAEYQAVNEPSPPYTTLDVSSLHQAIGFDAPDVWGTLENLCSG